MSIDSRLGFSTGTVMNLGNIVERTGILLNQPGITNPRVEVNLGASNNWSEAGLAALVAVFRGAAGCQASVHFPTGMRQYHDGYEVNATLLRSFATEIGAERMVVHPNQIDMATQFRYLLRGLKIGIENLGPEKEHGYKTPGSLKPMLDLFGDQGELVLDVNHAIAADPDGSPELLELLLRDFEGRIGQFHVSAYDPQGINHGLYYHEKHPQLALLRMLPAGIPVIHEGVIQPQDIKALDPEERLSEIQALLANERAVISSVLQP